MKISIIGPGALGCLFAVRLAEAGEDVTLVDYEPERAARLQKAGITLSTQDGDHRQEIPVSTRAPHGQDLILVTVKSHATARLSVPGDAPVLTLQNGLDNVERLCAAIGSSQVLAGVCGEASEWLEEGRVAHRGAGVTRFGAWTTCPPGPAVAALEKAGFRCEVTEAPGQAMWERAAISAGVEPLAALLGVPNGKLLEIPETRQLLRDLVVEAVKVASTEGYRFDYSLVESAEEHCSRLPAAVAPMLQDVRRNKETEVEALSGEIIRRGQMASLPTPRTRMAYQLLKGLERR